MDFPHAICSGDEVIELWERLNQQPASEHKKQQIIQFINAQNNNNTYWLDKFFSAALENQLFETAEEQIHRLHALTCDKLSSPKNSDILWSGQYPRSLNPQNHDNKQQLLVTIFQNKLDSNQSVIPHDWNEHLRGLLKNSQTQSRDKKKYF